MVPEIEERIVVYDEPFDPDLLGSRHTHANSSP